MAIQIECLGIINAIKHTHDSSRCLEEFCFVTRNRKERTSRLIIFLSVIITEVLFVDNERLSLLWKQTEEINFDSPEIFLFFVSISDLNIL